MAKHLPCSQGFHTGKWLVWASNSKELGFRDARAQRARLDQLGGSCINSAGPLTAASQSYLACAVPMSQQVSAAGARCHHKSCTPWLARCAVCRCMYPAHLTCMAKCCRFSIGLHWAVYTLWDCTQFVSCSHSFKSIGAIQCLQTCSCWRLSTHLRGVVPGGSC